MPRPTSVARITPTGPAPSARLRPPDDLGDGPERELFLQLVLSVKPDHFSSGDLPVLTAFCRACITERVAHAELSKAAISVPTASLAAG